MNSHSDIKRLLSPYSGDDLSSHERTLLEEHLKSCPDCLSELADLQTTLKLLRTTQEIEPPIWLTTRIMANVREQRELKTSWLKRIFFPLHIKLPIEGFALILVCMTGFYLSQKEETELQQPAVEKADKILPFSPPVTIPRPPEKKIMQAVPVYPSKDLSGVTVQKSAEEPIVVDKPATPPSIAQSPLVKRENVNSPGTQENRSMAELHRTAPKVESLSSNYAAPAMDKKVARGADKNSGVMESADSSNHAGSPPIAITLTQITIRLNMTTSADAFSLIHQAVIRSGGAIVHEPPSITHHIKAQIPVSRVEELFQKLDKIGKIVERPQYTSRSGTAEVNIFW